MEAVLLMGDGSYFYDLHHMIVKEVDTFLFKGKLERPGELFYSSKQDNTELQIYNRQWQLVKNGSQVAKGTVKGDATALSFVDASGKALLTVDALSCTGRLETFYIQLHKKWELGSGTGFSPSY